MLSFKKIVYSGFIFILGAGLALSASYRYFKVSSPDLQAFDMNVWIEEVLRLGVLDVQISQMYSFESKGITVYDYSVPFTQQESLTLVEGKVLLGYDLKKVSSKITEKNIEIVLPESEILSMDLDFKFISESDSFLNRITPKMRSKMMSDVKKQIAQPFKRKYQKSLDQRMEGIVALLQQASQKKIYINKAK